MNIQNRIWSPDTCQCIITMEMDTDTQTEYVPVQSYINKEGVESIIFFCTMHDRKDLQISYDAAVLTNRTKNNLEGVFNSTAVTRRALSRPEMDMLKLMAVANGTASSLETAQATLEIRDKEYKWKTDTKGKVELDLSSFSAQDKAALEAEIIKTLPEVIIK